MSHAFLRTSTALAAGLALSTPLAAQETGGAGFLGTLFLTGGKRDLAIGSAVAHTVVDQEEIEDRQASTIAQLVDATPGVTLVNGTTPQGSGINIRGFGANNTFGSDQKIAIQIDGASMGSEELYRMGTQLFSDPLLFRQVDVLRGTIGSFAYGSGVVGGVVRLETRNASDYTGGVPGFAFQQSLEARSNASGFSSSSTLAWQPNESAEFLLNYSYRDQGDYTAGDGSTITNSAFRTPSYLAKAHFTFGEDKAHSLTFSATRTVADDKDVPYDQFGTSGGTFGNVDRLTDTTQATLAYAWTPSGTDLIDLSVTLSHADQKIDYSYVTGSSPLEGTPAFAFLSATVNANQRYETTKLKVANTALFDTGALSHQLDSGIELSRRKRKDNEAASAPGGEDTRLAVYLVDEMRAGGFTVTPALRYETSRVTPANSNYASYENDALMGGLALSYEFANGFAVFGSAALTQSLPIIDDLGDSDASLYKMTTAEKARTFELGASYSGFDLFQAGDSLGIRGNFYKTEMWDITSYTVAGSQGTLLDRVETRGFELEASYALQNGVYFDLNGHVGDGREYNPDGSEAPWRVAAANSAQLTLGKKWDDWLDLSWEIKRGWNMRDSGGDSLPDATVHTLRATYRPAQGLFSGMEMRLGIENVLDTDYTAHLSSPTRKAPGRSFVFGLSKTF